MLGTAVRPDLILQRGVSEQTGGLDRKFAGSPFKKERCLSAPAKHQP